MDRKYMLGFLLLLLATTAVRCMDEVDDNEEEAGNDAEQLIEQLQEELAATKAQLARYKAAAQELETHKAQLETLTSQLAKAQQDVLKAQRDSTQCSTDLHQANAKVQQQLSQLAEGSHAADTCQATLQQVATQLERTKEELAAAASAATHFTLPPWAQEALTTAKDAAHTAYTQASALAGQAYTQAAGLAAQGVAALQGSEAGAKLVEGVQQLAARVEPLAAAAKDKALHLWQEASAMSPQELFQAAATGAGQLKQELKEHMEVAFKPDPMTAWLADPVLLEIFAMMAMCTPIFVAVAGIALWRAPPPPPRGARAAVAAAGAGGRKPAEAAAAAAGGRPKGKAAARKA